MHFNDPQGTVKQEQVAASLAPTTDGYVTTAEGQPLPLMTQPVGENHIRFHGGFLEEKEFSASPGSDKGHFYRMGVRHFSPALGRFLQRDALTYRRPPFASMPLRSNPYAYAHNQPTEYADPSGCQALMPGRRPEYETEKLEAPGTGAEDGCEQGWSHEECGCMGLCCRSRSGWEYSCDPCKKSAVVCIWQPSEILRDCECECCSGREGEHAPTKLGGGGTHWTGRITDPDGPEGPYGPPSYGPNGDGGSIWEFPPVPGGYFPWGGEGPIPLFGGRSVHFTGIIHSMHQMVFLELPAKVLPGIGTMATYVPPLGQIGDLAASVSSGYALMWAWCTWFRTYCPGQNEYAYRCWRDACCAASGCLRRWWFWGMLAGAVVVGGLGWWLGGNVLPGAAIGAVGGIDAISGGCATVWFLEMGKCPNPLGLPFPI